MLDILTRLFDPAGFPPRWKCGVWSPELGWLHVLSDLGVWSAYTAIPVVLVYFAARRRGLPFRRIFWLFGAFILLCGTTHLMEAVIFWWPGYRLAGLLKLATAVVSWATVFALIGVVPKAFSMRTPEELEREVVARRAAEAELVRANSALEERVRERTEELRAERERFRTTLASIGDSVVATDDAGRVTFLNPAAEAYTGWDAGAALGLPLREVLTVVSESTRQSALTATMRALTNSVVPEQPHDRS